MDRWRNFNSENEWVQSLNNWLVEQLAQAKTRHPGAPPRIFLPAGDTPRPLYRNWREKGAPFPTDTQLVQVDEVITGRKAGCFRQFFEEELPALKNQFEWVRADGQGAPIALLGIGLNGHVAFHEPHLEENFFAGEVTLAPSTTDRLGTEHDARALTYGVGAFLQCDAVALLVRGSSKDKILEQIQDPRSTLPAARLWRSGNTTIFKTN